MFKRKDEFYLQKSDIVFKIVAVLFMLLILFPFIWLFLSSLKTNVEYYTQPSPIFSKSPNWNRYKYIMIDLKFYKYIFNSIVLAIICVFLNVLSSSLIAYGFARFNFKYKSLCFIILLLTMFLPAQATFIPQFMLFNKLGWLNTYLPIIIPQGFGSAANIFLITNFMKSIPKEMDEAAKIDGANSFIIWLKIILPQSISVLIVVAISTFIGSWKDSMGPLIYLRNEDLYTLPVALMFFQSPDQNSYLLLLTGVVISIIPTIIMYIFMQKWLDKGIYISDLK